MYGKPAAWINVAAAGRGKGAEDTLATVLGYLGTDIVTAACRRIPVDRATIGPKGGRPLPGQGTGSQMMTGISRSVHDWYLS
jgi:hypothetical protein